MFLAFLAFLAFLVAVFCQLKVVDLIVGWRPGKPAIISLILYQTLFGLAVTLIVQLFWMVFN